MDEKDTSLEQISFKDGMHKLEEIVAQLEGGDMELEESLKRYSEGVKLLSVLQGKLDSAEQEVKVLMGELESAPEDGIQDTTLSKA
ncbi:MAG: exodeoxyribonuclease VII small subunit [Eggerthellaceae bacterium]|nr:exodeoxyribonuclease VII small subunit [Eggerthellaceae bacterium]